MIWLIILFLILDVGSKILVSNLMYQGESIRVISNFFRITYVRNTGAGFSIFADKSYLVLIISVLIIGAIIFYVYKNKPDNKLDKVIYALIIGGALGNFIDRVIYGYVIDFLDFLIFSYDYPIFNLADIFIVVGVILLIIKLWKRDMCGNRSNRK